MLLKHYLVLATLFVASTVSSPVPVDDADVAARQMTGSRDWRRQMTGSRDWRRQMTGSRDWRREPEDLAARED
ncbi:hypothetical protein K435DRAFT_779283 [Dendrothele bispora CBS 962.96]|uniref:Uncharacterized protein n=1 Tax=Dendrothele bispora (strain CBS 962.96) TaxID=1314807 RepID=A0A4V4HFG5_DENBC|nr:hypothetical protein K435DRAFT_780592 [Dendrothele bispora CBS 962.96]THU94875.1 hypothetical protein K435DRAFT_779283 [Dendrothele bispora CBS 962.96]